MLAELKADYSTPSKTAHGMAIHHALTSSSNASKTHSAAYDHASQLEQLAARNRLEAAGFFQWTGGVESAELGVRSAELA